MKQRHSLPHPVPQVSDHVSVQYISSDDNKPVEKQYDILNTIHSNMQEYEPLYFDEDVHISTVFNCTADSQRFLKEL